MRNVIAATALAGLAACAPAPINRNSDAPLAPVGKIDVNRYLGRWYEIARFENRFERGCEAVTADYQMRDDGLIRVINSCRKGSPDGRLIASRGIARIVDRQTNAKLKVSFFRPFWGDYWILDVADDYSRAIVGEPSGRLVWILSRTLTISRDAREDAISKLKALGYDTSALHFTKQPAGTEAPTAE